MHSVVICDTTLLALAKRRFPHLPIVALPPGESQKRLSTVEWLCTQLLQLGCDRQTILIGFGGGVIGDITGLAANLFMRGIAYQLVPTTVLAMIDSSIGGKTGVDLAVGKNLVGTIYPPMAVVRDITLLKTLPADEFSNGMAEVVKHGLLDKMLFVWLEKNTDKIKRRHASTLQTMVKLNVAIKTAIVEQDQREQHERMLLNLGHTFGHAFECLSDYTLPHGQAVAVGLAYATAYSGMPERSRVLALLQEFGLPTSLQKPFSPPAIVQAMLADKKHQGHTITLILPIALGQVQIKRGVTPAAISKFLKRYQG